VRAVLIVSLTAVGMSAGAEVTEQVPDWVKYDLPSGDWKLLHKTALTKDDPNKIVGYDWVFVSPEGFNVTGDGTITAWITDLLYVQQEVNGALDGMALLKSEDLVQVDRANSRFKILRGQWSSRGTPHARPPPPPTSGETGATDWKQAEPGTNALYLCRAH